MDLSPQRTQRNMGMDRWALFVLLYLIVTNTNLESSVGQSKHIFFPPTFFKELSRQRSRGESVRITSENKEKEK